VALVAVSVVAALLVAAVLTLWGERGRLKRELATALATRARPGLAPGTPAPEFAASAIRGSAGSLTELRRTGRATILVFLSTNCGPCMEMLGTLAGWQESLARAVTLAPIFSGERDHIARLVEENHLHSALAQVDNEVFDLYELRATPSAVLVDPDGAIASLPAEGVPAIEALIRVAISDADRPHLAVEHA
jgi:thiol-disulfide isomerase/thioredoxin